MLCSFNGHELVHCPSIIEASLTFPCHSPSAWNTQWEFLIYVQMIFNRQAPFTCKNPPITTQSTFHIWLFFPIKSPLSICLVRSDGYRTRTHQPTQSHPHRRSTLLDPRGIRILVDRYWAEGIWYGWFPRARCRPGRLIMQNSTKPFTSLRARDIPLTALQNRSSFPHIFFCPLQYPPSICPTRSDGCRITRSLYHLELSTAHLSLDLMVFTSPNC